MNKAILCTLLSILIASCTGGGEDGGGGDSGSKSGSNLTPLNSPSDLNGNYNLNQTSNMCVNISGSYSEMLIIEISGNTFKAKTFGFHLQDCYGVLAYSLVSVGSIAVTGENSVSVYETSATGETYTSTATSDFNSSSTCGLSGWASNTPRSILGTSCDGLWQNYSQFDWTQVSKTGNNVAFTNSSNVSNTLYPIVEKSTFSNWTYNSDTSLSVNFTGQTEETFFSATIVTELSSSFLAVLNGAGRDTTGLVAGNTYTCNMLIYVDSAGTTNGYDDIGYVFINGETADTPLNNACLEQDNDCDIGMCNYDGGHIYYRFSDRMYVDYYAENDADSGSYITDTFQ